LLSETFPFLQGSAGRIRDMKQRAECDAEYITRADSQFISATE